MPRNITAPPLTEAELAAIASVDEIEAQGRARMTPPLRDYIDSPAGSGAGLQVNREGFAAWLFRPRILRDVRTIELATTVLGHPVRTPVLLGASALHRLSHDDGELATARAVAAEGSLMMLSTSSSTPVEAVVPVAGNAWMQLYWMTDRGVTRAIVERAEAAGVQALALTVDAPRLGWREREAQHGDWDTGGVVQVHLPDPWPEGLAIESGLTWADLDWLRGITRLPIVLKGVLTAEDARIAADTGIPAVVVSNHGGRQIDYAQSPIDALPAIADAVGDRMELYLDSGVRRGTDVVKALALGARAVFLGRQVHWALALGGEAGVQRLLALVNGELRSAMGILGVTRVDALSRDAVVRRPGW